MYKPGLIVCQFVATVTRSDVEEFLEVFSGAKLQGQSQERMTQATCSVPIGEEDDFVDYANSDSMVKTASRVKADE